MIVLKRDGGWEIFDPDKVRNSIKRAAMVTDDHWTFDVDAVTKTVTDHINVYGGKICSDTIRAMVVSALCETRPGAIIANSYIVYNRHRHPRPITSEEIAEFVGQIIDVFEDFLESKGVEIPNDEKEQSEDPAILYGMDYGDIQSNIESVLYNWGVYTGW